MFNNVVLDVAIGLVFIYLLYSLLATAINEFIAMIFAYRHRMLEKGIEQMLDGKNYSYYWWDKVYNFILYLFSGKPTGKTAKQNGKIIKLFKKEPIVFFNTDANQIDISKTYNYYDKRSKLSDKENLYAAKIINHPLYRRKSEQSLLYNKPAYLTASAFSDILFDVLSNRQSKLDAAPILMDTIKKFVKDKINNNDDLKSILNIYIEQANGDVQKFKLLLEDWFDDSMNRVSGWYKRQATKILFLIGIILAFAFNVSTIEIVHKLSVNKDLREATAQVATRYVQSKNSQEVKSKVKDESVKSKVKDDSVNQEFSKEEAEQRLKDIKTFYNDTLAKVNTMMGLGWGDFGYKSSIIEKRKNDSIRFQGYINNRKTRMIYFTKVYKGEKNVCYLKVPQDKDEVLKEFKTYLDSKYKLNGKATFWEMIVYIFRHLTFIDFIGFILTALAITLGAPFWFDLLNKFVNIRAGGNKPAEDKTASSTTTVSKTVTLNQKQDPKSFA